MRSTAANPNDYTVMNDDDALSPASTRPTEQEAGVGLPRWTILVVIAAVILAAGSVLAVLLLWISSASLSGKELAAAHLDAIKTALSVAVGVGGLFALHLAIRRQRSTEIDSRRLERAQLHAEADAAERRITEIYTKAVEQLGSDKAAVRIGALYSLERVAQDHPVHRQTVANVLCAYLRMPFEPPTGKEPDEGAPEEVIVRRRSLIEERQVRLTAQRILHAHLQPAVCGLYWAVTDLDLTNASLPAINLAGADLKGANFAGAQMNRANFQGANLSLVSFELAKMASCDLTEANLYRARFALSRVMDSTLVGVNLDGARIFDSNFEQADFSKALIARTSLPDASLVGADLSTAVFVDVNLGDSLWDDTTKWPTGIDVQARDNSFLETRFKTTRSTYRVNKEWMVTNP